MRKALILGLLAAATAVPATAMAQNVSETAESRNEQRREARQERRAQRQEARQQRQAPAAVQAPPVQRQERRAERQQARQQRQAPAVQQRQERRSERAQVQPGQPLQGWIGNPNDPRMEAHRRRYERLDRQNVRRNGTPDQYQALVADQRGQRRDRRDERQENRRERRDDRRDNRQDWRDDRRDNRQDWRQDRRDDRRDWRQDRRDDRRWNRDWRRDQRYDWQRYRNSNRFVFRIQPYYAPYRGYSYRRFTIGSILDRLFWGRNYWISDPWQYRLPAAPYGYQWVRYYNDVVLVDTYTGEIVDVIHDFFW